MGILMCLIYSLFIYYLQSTTKLNYKLWDVNTVTPADFTVEYTISHSMWDDFCANHLQKGHEKSKCILFEDYLKVEI